MNESVLQTIKKLLGLSPDYEEFDVDIIIHINSAIFSLTQIGLGTVNGYKICSQETTWSEVFSSDRNLESIKNYIYLKVKMLFDPPSNSKMIDATNEFIKELEWRLNVQTSYNKEDT